MRARVVLHLAALLLPVLPLAGWMLVVDRSLDWNSFAAMLFFAGPAVLAAQLAAWLRWKALQARAMANGPAWLTGLGMAAITHLLFGVLLVLTLLVASGAGEWTSMESWWQLPAQALFFAFVSLSLTGVVTLPATAWIAHRVARHYQKELASEPA